MTTFSTSALAELFDFAMTVNGVAVLGEIRDRENWILRADFVESTYTLTVTDELLERVGFVE